MLDWFKTPRGRSLPRVTVWFGELKLAKSAQLDPRRFAALTEPVARGERFLEVRVEGGGVTVVGFDWRDDYEKLDGVLGGILEQLAKDGAKGTVHRYSEVGAAIRDGKPSTWEAERWVKWTLKGRCEIDEGTRVGEKKVLAALDAVLPRVEAWFAAHPDARARLEHRQRFGYIDREGREVVAPTLHRAYEFTDGLAVVNDGTGAGLIGPDGRMLPGRWESAEYFLRGLAPVMVDQRWGFVDREGAMRVAPQFAQAQPFRGPLAIVHTGDFHNRQQRWMNADGALVGDAFDYTTGFAEDLAWVYTHASASFGCIDAHGLPAFERRVRSAGVYSEGLAAASGLESTKFGYVDRAGKTVVPETFDEAHLFGEGRAAVKLGKTFRLIDAGGALRGTAFEGVVGGFSEGLMAVRIRGRVGFLDRDGEVVIAPKFEEAYGFYEGLAYARVKGLWGHFDRTGAWVIEPRLEWTNRFDNGLAPAKRDGLFGFIDRSGQFVIAPRWKQMQPGFSDGRAWVQLP